MRIFLIILMILEFHIFELTKSEKEQKEPKDNFPYVVSVRMKNMHVCGGTLISATFVLTGAQCFVHFFNDFRNIYVEPPQNFRVIAGTKNIESYNDENSIKVKRVYLHPYFFKDRSLLHDVGLAELEKSNITNKFIKLPNRFQISKSLKSKTACTLVGWKNCTGTTSCTRKFQYSNTYLYSKMCIKHFPTKYFRRYLQLCSYKFGVDPWNGGYGGPLICNGKQYGIVSYIINRENTPTVHTRVDVYQSWITRISGVSMSTIVKNKIINLIFCLMLSISMQHEIL